MLLDNRQIVERRTEPPEQSVWWGRLTLAQKFSASSLGKFGYELEFIRFDHGRSLAVLMCQGGIAVISEDGEINTKIKLKVRKN